MANWYYYNKKGEKVGPISVAALKALTLQGLITKETVIANHTGRTAVAGKVNGLAFPETKPSEPPMPLKPETALTDEIDPASVTPTKKAGEQDEAIAMQFGNVLIHTVAAPEQSDVYGLSAPAAPVEANPFAATPPIPELPPPVEPPVAAVNNTLDEEDDPFTAVMPEEANPFTFVMPEEDNSFAGFPES